MWSELVLYHPYTIDATVLKKQEKEDKIFQLLASLDPNYEDLCSLILMNHDLPSLTSVCVL
jgi:threonine/homoserine efflux transporter RhtA